MSSREVYERKIEGKTHRNMYRDFPESMDFEVQSSAFDIHVNNKNDGILKFLRVILIFLEHF